MILVILLFYCFVLLLDILFIITKMDNWNKQNWIKNILSKSGTEIEKVNGNFIKAFFYYNFLENFVKLQFANLFMKKFVFVRKKKRTLKAFFKTFLFMRCCQIYFFY